MIDPKHQKIITNIFKELGSQDSQREYFMYMLNPKPQHKTR